MKLIPAIDLLDGRCVRLMRGNFEEVTHYDVLPAALSKSYHEAGAEWLHVVDLAASRDGEAADTAALFKLLQAAPSKVQTGGGVRNGGDIQARLDNGAHRVVIGSLCATETQRVAQWLKTFGPQKIVAAIDVQLDEDARPWPRIYGWTEEADRDLWALLDQLVPAGLVHVLITDIGRDGAMHGPNVELYQLVKSRYPGLEIQASGGVSRLEDLKELKQANADAAITGKALLEKVFSVRQALDALA